MRWANIVNAHIFPGPAIVSALSSAAKDAVVAYSSTVETCISGAGSDDVDDIDSDMSSDHSMFKPTFAESSSQDGPPSAPSDRPGRKQSVVSITTSISTRTENITNPFAQHKRDLSSTDLSHQPNIGTVDEQSKVEIAESLQHLGPAPLARGLLLLAEMSSADNLMDASYAQQCAKHARTDRDFVVGFIAQSNLNTEPEDNFLIMTPGVSIASKGDGLGQTYNDPEHVVGRGTDVVIVGRGIVSATDRVAACKQYRDRSWKAYESRVKR